MCIYYGQITYSVAFVLIFSCFFSFFLYNFLDMPSHKAKLEKTIDFDQMLKAIKMVTIHGNPKASVATANGIPETTLLKNWTTRRKELILSKKRQSEKKKHQQMKEHHRYNRQQKEQRWMKQKKTLIKIFVFCA